MTILHAFSKEEYATRNTSVAFQKLAEDKEDPLKKKSEHGHPEKSIITLDKKYVIGRVRTHKLITEDLRIGCCKIQLLIDEIDVSSHCQEDFCGSSVLKLAEYNDSIDARVEFKTSKISVGLRRAGPPETWPPETETRARGAETSKVALPQRQPDCSLHPRRLHQRTLQETSISRVVSLAKFSNLASLMTVTRIISDPDDVTWAR
uniref:Arrestin_C domain-containing protein n=1 Tax=Steinernema glaseri TaxID=37863 RepID=A0A1I8AL69_9BILA